MSERDRDAMIEAASKALHTYYQDNSDERLFPNMMADFALERTAALRTENDELRGRVEKLEDELQSYKIVESLGDVLHPATTAETREDWDFPIDRRERVKE